MKKDGTYGEVVGDSHVAVDGVELFGKIKVETANDVEKLFLGSRIVFDNERFRITQEKI